MFRVDGGELLLVVEGREGEFGKGDDELVGGLWRLELS